MSLLALLSFVIVALKVFNLVGLANYAEVPSRKLIFTVT
jgi:hypothetical protein